MNAEIPNHTLFADPPSFRDRVVAFIDILGFEAEVRRSLRDRARQAKVHAALLRAKSVKKSSLSHQTAQTDLEVTIFSDSIALSASAENLHGVVYTVIHLQADLLELGVLVRGGIARGQTVHEDDLVYGEGMLDAISLEKAAVYPRIIVSPKLIKGTPPTYQALFFSQDADGLWFINPFAMGLTPQNAADLAADGHCPWEISLTKLGERIEEELARLTDVRHLAKWQWLKHQHTNAMLNFAKLGQPPFWDTLVKLQKRSPKH